MSNRKRHEGNRDNPDVSSFSAISLIQMQYVYWTFNALLDNKTQIWDMFKKTFSADILFGCLWIESLHYWEVFEMINDHDHAADNKVYDQWLS